MKYNHFLLLKKIKNTESAQLCGSLHKKPSPCSPPLSVSPAQRQAALIFIICSISSLSRGSPTAFAFCCNFEKFSDYTFLL